MYASTNSPACWAIQLGLSINCFFKRFRYQMLYQLGICNIKVSWQVCFSSIIKSNFTVQLDRRRRQLLSFSNIIFCANFAFNCHRHLLLLLHSKTFKSRNTGNVTQMENLKTETKEAEKVQTMIIRKPSQLIYRKNILQVQIRQSMKVNGSLRK